MSSRMKDLFSGVLVFFVGILFYLQTLKIRPVKIGLSPADFPRLVTAALMVCGVILILKALITKKIESKKLEPVALRKIGSLVVVFVLYALFLNRIGFLYLTPAFLFASMYVFGMKKHVLNAVISIVVTIAVYFVFAYVFKVPLPRFSL
ncbi:MAG: tripartite tricarboxylate transporter TctB family protein [Pseudothermotoga sp.]